jgi:hypothetical protein
MKIHFVPFKVYLTVGDEYFFGDYLEKQKRFLIIKLIDTNFDSSNYMKIL